MNLGEFFTQNSHVNDVTGCVIWDGDYIKSNIPVASVAGSSISVRKMVYEALNGTQPYRTKFLPSCENEKCVKVEHINLVHREGQTLDVDPEKIAEAVRLRDEGYRLDIIGDKLGVKAPTISKWLKHHKAQKEAGEHEG